MIQELPSGQIVMKLSDVLPMVKAFCGEDLVLLSCSYLCHDAYHSKCVCFYTGEHSHDQLLCRVVHSQILIECRHTHILIERDFMKP